MSGSRKLDPLFLCMQFKLLAKLCSTIGGGYLRVSLLSLFISCFPYKSLWAQSQNNLNPLFQIYGYPSALSQSNSHGIWSNIQLITANLYARSNEPDTDEVLIMDTEITRLELAYGKRWERLQAGISVPLLSYNTGSMDGVVDGWHDLFNMPDRGRESVPRGNVLLYYHEQYGYLEENELPRRDGDEDIYLNRPESGLGDVQLRLAWHRTERQQFQVTLKLPTGNPDYLFGSGAADVAFSGLLGFPYQLDQRHFELSIHGGFLWMGPSQVLADKHRSVSLFGGGTVTYVVFKRWNANVGLYGQTSPYHDSQLKLITGNAVQATIGMAYIGKDEQWYIGFVEDINSGLSPDFGIHLSWHKSWR